MNRPPPTPTLFPNHAALPICKSTTGTHILRELENAGDEVDSAEYIYRMTTTPGVPSAVTDPPKILVPQNIGLYPVQTS